MMIYNKEELRIEFIQCLFENVKYLTDLTWVNSVSKHGHLGQYDDAIECILFNEIKFKNYIICSNEYENANGEKRIKTGFTIDEKKIDILEYDFENLPLSYTFDFDLQLFLNYLTYEYRNQKIHDLLKLIEE